MRTLIVCLLSLVVAYVQASAACDILAVAFRASAGGVLSYKENKALIVKEVKQRVKKAKSRYGADTLLFFNFNLYAAPFINVPKLTHMPNKWTNPPGVGPSKTSSIGPRYFKSNQKAALTCQFDCLSTINKVPAYSKCEFRYYTYAAYQYDEGCFDRKAINDQQARLVSDICTTHNKCTGNNWAVTKENIALSKGDNTKFIPALNLQ